MSSIWIDKFTSSWAKMTNDVVEKKQEKRKSRLFQSYNSHVFWRNS